MNILVCVKAVPDPDHVIRETDTPVGRIVDICMDESVDFAMNRFDDYAVEEAVLIKEAYPDTVVDIVSMGPENALKVIKRGIGMGADAGIHILSGYGAACDATITSGCIARVAERKPYDLILCGVMSEDMMQLAVGPMIAARLNIPWVTSVIKEELNRDQKTVYAEQELEGGSIAMHELQLPALLTLQSGINQPRYPSLSNMLRANRGIIEVIQADRLYPRDSLYRIVGYSYPGKTREGKVLEGTPEEKAESLLRILKENALI